MNRCDVVEEAANQALLDSLTIPATLTVCFVCTGNTCRSPMAAALFNHLAKGQPMRAFSAGLYAVPGTPIAENAVAALKKAGVAETPDNRFTAHRAQIITAEMMEKADRVVCMTAGHAMRLLGAFPQYAGKIATFRKDVSDPYGGDLAQYEKCLAQIREELLYAFPALGAGENPAAGGPAGKSGPGDGQSGEPSDDDCD